MAYDVLAKCPVCGGRLEITGLRCTNCDTRYQGSFKPDKFSCLTAEQRYFIEIFVKCRGNIKDVEGELNISYPTVRGKLDDVISALGYQSLEGEKPHADRRKILDMLSSGRITYEEALKMMGE